MFFVGLFLALEFIGVAIGVMLAWGAIPELYRDRAWWTISGCLLLTPLIAMGLVPKVIKAHTAWSLAISCAMFGAVVGKWLVGGLHPLICLLLLAASAFATRSAFDAMREFAEFEKALTSSLSRR